MNWKRLLYPLCWFDWHKETFEPTGDRQYPYDLVCSRCGNREPVPDVVIASFERERLKKVDA